MASFGERLKRTRENQKITLDEVAVSTKISARMLRALEEEKFDQLPGGVFNKGFVRAYARHLGIDEEQAIADYVTAAGSGPVTAPEGEELRTIAEKKERERALNQQAKQLPSGALAVLLLLAALGLSLWGFYSRERVRGDKPHLNTRPSAPAGSLSTGQPSQTERAAPTGQQSPTEPSSETAGTESVSAQSSGTAAPASLPQPRYSPVTEQTSTTPTPGSFTVLIRAREDSWLSLRVDGKIVMEDTLVAASEKSVQAHRQVVLRAGNVGGLAFFFNGKKLSRQGDTGEVKTLAFGPNGLEP